MARSYAQSNEAIQAFGRWRHSAETQINGIGGPGFGQQPPFIPEKHLRKYFQEGRRLDNLLDAVIEGHDRAALDADYIQRHYSRTFAILLCTQQGDMIQHFQQHDSLMDQKLPFRTRPEEFPHTTPDRFEDFKKAQWQFCAPKLEYGMNLRFQEDCILPIIRKDKIGEGGSAIIYRIVVDESHDSLRPSNNEDLGRPSHQHTYVLKTYRSKEAEENFRAERDAFLRLRWDGKPASHIVAYYGSFVHGNSYNIILEYADQGNLETFMKKKEKPQHFEETLLFWSRLSLITHGLMTIHGRSGDEGSASQKLSRKFNGWHQDITPANILVFSGSSPSPFDYHFKLADLGLTHFKTPGVSQITEPSDFDAFGTCAYGAPEAYRPHPDSDSSPLQITQSVDTWSTGCVFSEAAVWANHGWPLVAQYRRQREKEVCNKGGRPGEHIFHHDGNLLQTVKDIHLHIVDDVKAHNSPTRVVLEHIVDDMLQHGARPTAKHVFEKSKRKLEELERRYGIPVTDSPRNSYTRISQNGGPLSSANTYESSIPQPVRHPSLRRFPPGQPLPPNESDTLNGDYGDDGGDFGDDPSSPMRWAQTSPRRQQHFTSQAQGHRSMQVSTSPMQWLPTVPTSVAGRIPDGSPVGERTPQQQEDATRPTLSLAEGMEWKRRRKSQEWNKLRKEDVHTDLPGSENMNLLNKRDHIFLIDNSATMEQYRDQMRDLVSLLAYLLKCSDKDGVDTYFTQLSHKINSQKSSVITKQLKTLKFKGISHMRMSLQSVLQEHRSRFGKGVKPPRTLRAPNPSEEPQKPLSVYILTDAKWQPQCDVGGFIKDLVRDMMDTRCAKEHVALQFVRFGNDEASIRMLNELDHGLGLKILGMDIVDHTYWDDNIWKILLGGLVDWYDQDPPPLTSVQNGDMTSPQRLSN